MHQHETNSPFIKMFTRKKKWEFLSQITFWTPYQEIASLDFSEITWGSEKGDTSWPNSPRQCWPPSANHPAAPGEFQISAGTDASSRAGFLIAQQFVFYPLSAATEPTPMCASSLQQHLSHPQHWWNWGSSHSWTGAGNAARKGSSTWEPGWAHLEQGIQKIPGV